MHISISIKKIENFEEGRDPAEPKDGSAFDSENNV
jgi:hypothetical protein